MDYKKVLKGLAYTFVVLILFVFFLVFVQMFSGNLEKFVVWKTLYESSLLGSIEDAVFGFNAQKNGMRPQRNWEISDLQLNAESGISVLVEPSSDVRKILFGKTEDKEFPIASLTKLMTALIVVENYDLSSAVTIGKFSSLQAGEQGMLEPGQIFSVKSLLHITLIESSNDAAHALSQVAGNENFIHMMNKKASELGMSKTRFADSSGLSPESKSSANDLAKLAAYIILNRPEISEITKMPSYDAYMQNGEFHHTAQSTNKILGEVSQIVLGKTGYTYVAKECFLLAKKSPDGNGYIINVVLGSTDRFVEMKKIINWVQASYTW